MNTLILAALLVAICLLLWLLLLQQRAPEQDEPLQEDARISPLLRGINYLLSDEPDRALRELVQVAKLRTETAEVYLALGGMFRTKGEYGRAVRIHQNLLVRPDLPEALHIQAQLALAQDFQAGGLLDRALVQYGKVLDRRPDHVQALGACLRIREQSSEWKKAESLLMRLDRVRGTSSTLHQAYLLAEMAVEQKNRGHHKAALRTAEQAIQMDAGCASAHVLLTEVRLAQHDEAGALASMQNLRDSAPQHLPLLVPLLLADRGNYQKKGKAFLLDYWQEKKNEAFALAWLEAICNAQGRQAARRLLDVIGFTPSSLRACLRLEAVAGKTGEPLAEFARQWRESVRNYYCTECGVEVVEMRWQCPQCHTWGSMRPIAGKEA